VALNPVSGSVADRELFRDSANLVDPNETRHAYVTALRAADTHDFDALIAFAQSPCRCVSVHHRIDTFDHGACSLMRQIMFS
jgi:hypothetical protein